MQATIDTHKRREYRQKILGNLSEIVSRIDELDRIAAETRNHLHLHDRFFFRHGTGLTGDETYGTEDDLVELYLDTCQMLSRLARAKEHMNAACALTHFYDYKTSALFDEFARAEDELL